ncbi:hypothetical protein C8A03DRAFT_12348 [Achaetomium macrosporum]|uniref:Pentatricopeptide repeat domain-containing protein n=1 Tax=Achaetomium macrosporum TaxID=79813 RepID=A0AAN7CG15_9PEZI|nr:hypothetical protein C8A03DRAFT_12348 [Achaetomium macrosporum]
MLGLWSMAAHLRACHCRACLRGANTAARRATTTSARSNPRRRKVLASDVFTACYSAIMATAAVIDAGRKDKRRRELDRELADARSSLAALLEESQSRDLAKVITSAYPSLPDSSPLEKLAVLKDICKLEPDYLRGLDATRKARFKKRNDLRKMFGLPGWKILEYDIEHSTLARCDEVMDAEAKDLSLVHQEVMDEEGLAKVTDMIADLTDRLLTDAYWVSEAEAPGTHPALESPDSARTMIRLVKSSGYPSYTHPHVDPRETIEQRARMNELNVKIMADWATPRREHYLAKICYNLLVCGVPPGIQNVNTLILGFSLLCEHKLAEAMVEYFHSSSMRPTEATFLCLLHHYRMKKDIVRFHDLIRRLFAYNSAGIGLMRRTADDVARDPSLRAWAKTADVRFVDGHYVQRAPLTRNLAEAMMEGLIDFDLLHEAARLFSVCLGEKWTISKDLMWKLFHSCLTFLDTAAARVIVRGLLNNIDQASSLLLGPDAIGPGLVRQLRHLLNMWQATTLFPGVIANEEVDDICQRCDPRRRTEKSNLDHLVTAIWIRETGHHNIHTTLWLKQAKRRLSADGPLSERLDKAHFALDLAINRPREKMFKAERIQRVARLEWLRVETSESQKKILDLETAICSILAEQAPRELRDARLLFDPDLPIKQRIAMALAIGTPGTVHHEAAMCFARSREIDWQLKEALLQALPLPLAKDLLETRNASGDVPLGRIVACFEQYLAEFKAEQDKQERASPLARLVSGLSLWPRSSGSPAATLGRVVNRGTRYINVV